MPTVSIKGLFGSKRPAFITFGGAWKPGDQPPQGYLDWHEWAGVQHKSGLRQVECGNCARWKYPQELSPRIVETKAFKDKAITKPVTIRKPMCNVCAGIKLKQDHA